MFSDSELKSYFDGEMPEDRAEALEAAVVDDPALEARLMALDPMAAPVAAAFEALNAPAYPEPVMQQPAASWGLPAMAASIALLVGLGAGWWLAQPGPEAPKGWVAAVADYQVLYQPQTVAVLTADAGDVAAQLARAGAAIGADLSGFAEARIGGAALLRAQVLGLADRPIVQMVYQLPDGTPLALCLTVQGSGAVEAMALELRGLAASRWQAGGQDILLIGDTGAATMADLATEARALTVDL